MNNTQIQAQPIPGSLASQAANSGQSLAQTFINADCVVLVDTSGSMSAVDGNADHLTRYQRACSELAKIQRDMPGKIAVISFSDDVMFCPAGTPFNYQSGTDLAKALNFAKMADVPEMRFIVISDGEPDDEAAALKAAKQYKNHIDTIYIGPAGGSGESFLANLAAASGGKAVKTVGAKELEMSVRGLLNG